MELKEAAYPAFFTATNLEWKNLLQPEKYKKIIVDSFQFLKQHKRVNIYGFVIMDNHLHLIWQMLNGVKRENVERDFLKFTAQQIKKDLHENHPLVLEQFRVNAKDREYQFWERKPLSIILRNDKIFKQKLEYIHNNPVKAGLCIEPEEYKYSSAKFYTTGVDEWGFIKHYQD